MTTTHLDGAVCREEAATLVQLYIQMGQGCAEIECCGTFPCRDCPKVKAQKAILRRLVRLLVLRGLTS